MNKCSFEYIASGCSHIRIVFKEAYENKNCLAYLKKSFNYLNTFSRHHKFSLLANAWTEPNFGEIFQNYKPSINQVMLDSGGLQIVTQGMFITDKIKEKIYSIQSKWSDSAMCFDEIPLSFNGDTSSRTDISNRWFDKDKFKNCAKITGKNVTRQIEIFLDEKSQTKPFVIVQGNCLETYCEWIELVLKEIPLSYHKYIQGVAMGAASLGYGVLEDIKKAFYFTQLPIECNNLHILGVGSISRLLPFIIFSQSGLYKNIHISYDSSTHTSGINMGRYFINGKNFNFPKVLDHKIWNIMYEDVKKNGFSNNESIKHFFIPFSIPSMEFKEKYGSRVPFIKIINSVFCSIIKNFITEVDKCFDEKSYLINKYTNVKTKNSFLSLYNIKNKEDFKSWEKNISRFINSKFIASHKRKETDLDNLF